MVINKRGELYTGKAQTGRMPLRRRNLETEGGKS